MATWTSRSSSSSSTRRTCSSTTPARPSSTRSTQTVRLIRSKGVGVFFVTQTPKDVPADVLAQLGNRVQHALRAFTPDDAKALKATVTTFPKSEFYDLEQLLHAARHRRGGGDDPLREGRARPRSCTRSCGPGLADGPGRRRRRRREGIAAVREVRHARGRAERAGDAARRPPRAGPEPGGRAGARAAAEAQRAHGRRARGQRRRDRRLPELARGQGRPGRSSAASSAC